jgi:hypothetical protein
MNLQIQLTDDLLPALARLIAATPGMAQMVAGELRGKKDTYTVAEMAEALNVDISTIRRRIKAGTIPTIPGVGPARIAAPIVERLLNPNPDA